MQHYCLASFLHWLDDSQMRGQPFSAKQQGMIQVAVAAYRDFPCQCQACKDISHDVHRFWRPRA